MKHRSVGIFVILAASLAVVPQASQELGAFRDAVGERVRAEIWNAFLSLQAQADGSGKLAAGAAPTVANCNAAGKVNAGSVLIAATTRSNTRNEPATRKAGPESSRMITDPLLGPPRLKAGWMSKWSPEAFNRLLRNAVDFDQANSNELATLASHDADFEPGSLSAAVEGLLGQERESRARRIENVDSEKSGVPGTVHVWREQRSGRRDARRPGDEIRRQQVEGANSNGKNNAKFNESHFRVFKVKAPNRNIVSIPIPRTLSVREPSCDTMDLGDEAPVPLAGSE